MRKCLSIVFSILLIAVLIACGGDAKLAMFSGTANRAPLTVLTTALPEGTVSATYQQSLSATGGTPVHHWTVVSGSLPAGLSLAADGTITGTPTSAGSSTFTVQVADSTSASRTANLAIRIVPVGTTALVATLGSLPSAAVSAKYQRLLTASGGVPPYRWSVVSGQLPPGLSLSGDGTVSGTPTDVGTYDFTAQVADSGSAADKSSLTINVASSIPFQYVLGDKLYPYSSQPKPAKGQSFVDATYHTTITRVTDSRADRNAWGTITEYPQWDPSSADGKYLLFEECSNTVNCGGYVLYDGNSFKYLKTIDKLGWWDGEDPEPRWDRTGAHLHRIIYRKHMQLRYYDLDTRNDGLVHDFTRDFPTYTPATESHAGYFIFSHEYTQQSTDGRYWAFYLRNASVNKDALALVYDIVQDKVVSQKSLAGASMKGVMMSPSGNYILVNGFWCASGEFCGERAFTRDFSKNVQVTNELTHMNFAWSSQGHEVAIAMNNGTDEVAFVRLDTGQVYVVYDMVNMGWNANMLHTYMSKPGWAFLNTYVQTNDKWDYNQIFAFEIDETKCLRWYDSRQSSRSHSCANGKPRIWRVSSTQNLADVAGSRYYFQQANVQANIAGTKLWFGANWRDINGAPDVYQVTLPPTWWDDLARMP